MRIARFIVAIACLPPAMAEQPVSLEWRPPVEIASGEGSVGPWRMNESDWRYVDDPTVAVAPDGSIGVAWVDQARKVVPLSLPQDSRSPGRPHEHPSDWRRHRVNGPLILYAI